MGETKQLAAFIAATSLDDIPTETRDHAKTAIRDFFGVALYGSHHSIGERIHSHVQDQHAGDESTVIGHGTASGTGAALANGTFGHAIDYDDTFESIVIHPTSPICSAAVAAAEMTEADGADVLTAYVIGVETAYRIGHSTNPAHYQNGWHSTGTIGSIGAAAASASAIGLDEDTTRHTLGIVASGSSSLKKNFGTMTKPLHAGHAAEMGLRSALLARNGFTADPAVLDGEMGYGSVMSPGGTYEPDAIVEALGSKWHVTDIGFKPYPSGVITHAAMDAMRTLVGREQLSPANVDAVTVTLDEAASEMLIHANPTDSLQAKFSIEFCLAAVLREGDAGVHEFTDGYVQAPETRAVIDRVERKYETDFLGGHYAGYGGRVTVETTDGTVHTETVQYAPGSPNNPLGTERLHRKFMECAETVLDDDAMMETFEQIETLETPGSFDRLTDLVSLDSHADPRR